MTIEKFTNIIFIYRWGKNAPILFSVNANGYRRKGFGKVLKKRIMILAIILFVLSSAFATSGRYNLKYIVYRYVEKNVFLFFTDTDGSAITTKPLEVAQGFDSSDAQVCLVCSTNEDGVYHINLTFEPMLRMDTASEAINRVYNYYKAQVWSPDNEPVSLGIVDVSSESNRTIKFVGKTVTDTSIMTDFIYPISFRFSDYIESYTTGFYSATITAEVTAQ